jgi:hypothetical protein
MKKVTVFIVLILSGCAELTPLPAPSSNQTTEISRFKFVIIPETGNISSVVANNGSAKGQEFSPSNLIEGSLLKRGIIRVNKPEPDIIDKLIITKYGTSGMRNILGGMAGYSQEVTITFVEARNLTPIFTCSAEGIGHSDVDDIREAITRCLRILR